MPVYEYACPTCAHVTEAIRRMAEADAALPCEKCGAPAKRQHSTFLAESAKPATTSQPWAGGPGGGGCGCGNPHGPCNR